MIAVRDWPPFRPIPTVNTGTYMNVIQEADSTQGTGRRDGALSRDELSSYRNNLQQQVQIWSWWGQLFGGFGFWGDLINKQVQQMQQKLDAANVMMDNFGAFANNDRNFNSISFNDVWNVANRDGNAATIASSDLNTPILFRGGLEPEPLPVNQAGVAGTTTPNLPD